MNDIEKLAREQLSHAEEMPPAEVWTRLQQRMHAQAPATPAQPAGAGRLWRWLLPVAALPVVGAVMFFAFRNSPSDVAETRQTAEIHSYNSSAGDMQDQETTPQVAMAAADVIPVTERKGYALAPAIQEDASIPAVANTETVSADVVSENRVTAVPVQSEPRQVSIAGMTPASQEADNTPMVVTNGDRDNAEDSPSASNVEAVRKNTPAATNARDWQKEHEAVDKLLMIPNLVTPNFDGYNDCWVLKNIESLGSVQVQIYTAQGKRVFSSSNYQNDFCGDDLPDGNYFYVIAIRNMQYSRRGVLVIRH